MRKHQPKNPAPKNPVPFIYRSFLNFWIAIILPITLIAMLITKLYYNNTINYEPLTEPSTWLYFVMLQVFTSFFTYLWIYRTKSKEYKS